VLDELANHRNRFDVIAGLDLGFRDDTAMPVILVKSREDGRLNFYIVDEYMQHHKDTASHAKYIGNLYEKYEIDYIYADPAAAQTIYDLASIYDIPSVKANKNKLEGIGMVASLIEHDQVFVSVNCVEVIYALRNYKWKSGVEKETPEHDRASHMADAIRYAIYTYCLANL
jgi:phage terminase large subunit